MTPIRTRTLRKATKVRKSKSPFRAHNDLHAEALKEFRRLLKPAAKEIEDLVLAETDRPDTTEELEIVASATLTERRSTRGQGGQVVRT
jgi:hypothetical protein